jgi:hypothetical protein
MNSNNDNNANNVNNNNNDNNDNNDNNNNNVNSGLNTNCAHLHSILSPTNGYEPEWDPDIWKKNKKYNNCYAYSVNDHDHLRDRKSIPGIGRSFYNCSEIIQGLYNDIPGTYITNFNCACTSGYSKIYSAVSNEEKNDFHFWRLDKDGLWSHKVGSHHPSRLDASGKLINNPETSDRNFESHNYVNSCGFFCIPLAEKILD